MQKTYNTTLLEILSISGYPNDKEKFVKEFEEVNHMEAMTHILPQLPQYIQEAIKVSSDPHVIQQYVPQEEYRNELTNVSKQAMINLYVSLSPLLDQNQREQIINLAPFLGNSDSLSL